MSAAQSIARQKMLTQPGHLYFAYSRYCDWVKIGFTSKPVAERIDGINAQYAEFAPFSLMGSVPSTWSAEQQLHRCLSPFRGRRKGRTAELYPALPVLVKNLRAVLTYRKWERMDWRRAHLLLTYAQRKAADPLAQVEVNLSYDRFYAERRAA